MVYKFGKHEIEFYSSIHTLPILRYQKFIKYQMIASDVGSDFTDYDRRTEKALAFLAKGMTNEAILELNNRRQAVYNAYNEFTPTGKTLAVLVKRIDDTQYTEFAPDDLDRIVIHLNNIGFDITTTLEKLQEVKKKITTELQVYFPKQFKRSGDMDFSSLRLQRCNLVLDSIIEQTEKHDKQLYDVEKEILERDKPSVWNVWQEDNMERALEVDFQKFGIAVCEASGQELPKMTTFAFYTTIELLRERKPPKHVN